MSLLASSFRENFIQMSAPAKLLLLVLLIIIFALFGTLLAMVIAVPLFDIHFMELTRIIGNPDTNNILVFKFLQTFQSITLFIVPAIIAAWLFSDNTFGYIKANRKVSWITLMLVLITLPAAIPLLNKVTELNANMDLPIALDWLEKRMIAMEEGAAQLTELFLASTSAMDLMINFMMIAILPAIGEEFLFRGVIQRLFTDWTKNEHIGILITAFLFSFIHFQFYGFIPRFMLGLFFGYLLFWSGSIWVPVAAHLINNGLAVFYYHFAADAMGETSLDTVGTGDSNYLLYLSVFLTSLFIGMLFLHEKGRKESLQ